MDFYHYISDFISDSQHESWNVLNCLQYLKDHVLFTSDSRQEILDAFLRAFKKVGESTIVHVGVRKKALRLCNNANETFQRREILEFFEGLDQAFDLRHNDREVDKSVDTAKVLIAKKATTRLEETLEIQEQRNNKKMMTEENFDMMENSGSTYEEGISDDENDETLQFAKVTNGMIAKKLVKIGKGIARYNVIFLPECNKNDLIRATFNEEWRTFEEFFSKREEEITSKISSPLNKVEKILNKYQEALKKATNEGYVELDSVFINYNYQDGYKFQRNWLENWVDNVYKKFLICFQISRHVLNDETSNEYQYRSWFVNLLCEDLFLDINSVIRLTTGEVENKHRKNQKDLSRLPENRRPIGWYHDGILTINVSGVDEYVGFLEVVGNAMIEDHKKMMGDRNKILKAMRLALFQLEQIMRNNGINDEEKLQQNLEIFGIQVYKRDFIFYAMHYYDGTYLVDETDLSFVIPNTPMQLYLLEDIIKKLLAFRARVQRLNTQMTELLRDMDIRRRSRRITTAIDVSPSSNINQYSINLKLKNEFQSHHGREKFRKL